MSEDEIGAVLLGNYWKLQAGDAVECGGHVVDVPVGDRLLGRIIDPTGWPLDGLGPLNSGTRLPVERPAAPIDITSLAKGNRGIFPFDRVYQIIDGRQEIKSHGSREMPIWGTAFRRQSSLYFDSYPVIDPESSARSRILALTEYVYRLQRK